ncbi:hypothetical protein HNP84_004343 [Thermocatellispora tengchongensis]|uniref:DUF1648 domain-containing protein n=1 Tax=Thermocatellispora tengchongensis TaxID=1073253 RepID=A0A840P9S8_9ACTN|nr:DUF1648 domain-containing protein [Thermocatellispora tengchongensis]MBB5134611.1 hypothetical protein [Thermocatellispora tengchongensis]
MNGPPYSAYAGRARLAAVAWVAVVTGAVAATPFLFRHRLPESPAVHWDLAGVPDRSTTFAGLLVLNLAAWAPFAVIALAGASRRALAARRSSRRAVGGALAGGGTFAVGLQVVILQANLDRGEWRDAETWGLSGPLLIAVSLGAGWLGSLAAGAGPGDRPEPAPEPAPLPRLRAHERAVWVSSSVNRSLSGLAVLGLGASLLVAGATLVVLPAATWALVVALLLLSMGAAVVSSVRVHVTDAGLSVAYGPLRRPVRHYPLAAIRGARAEPRLPMDVGGWGYRGRPRAGTLMIRGGDCLVVRFDPDGELAVTVDDAARGAALLNSLVTLPKEQSNVPTP